MSDTDNKKLPEHDEEEVMRVMQIVKLLIRS